MSSEVYMDELNFLVEQKAGIITTNFDELKKEIQTVMSAYEGIEVTDDNIAESKKDLAFLRKFKKSLDDKRKEVKKAYMNPYEEFETSFKELNAVIDKPINEIDSQLKEFDKKRIEEKKNQIKALYDENIEDYGEFIDFESTLEESWQTVSYKAKDYLYHLSEMKIRVRSDLDVIKSLDSEIEDVLIDIFKQSGNNLSPAITRNTQYLKDKERVSAQIKEDAKTGITTLSQNNAFDYETMASKINMVHFVVSTEDADKVEALLTFNEIVFRKE